MLEFGKILSFENNNVEVENSSHKIEIGYIGFHVVFEFGMNKLVGEILSITESTIKIMLVGEIKDSAFVQDIIKKPSIDSKIRIIYSNELPYILGDQNINSKNYLLLGKSVTYQNFNLSININKFFSNHFAIIGNSGSGKSCAFARMIQNLFYKVEHQPINSNIVIFDFYGEYNPAWKKINELRNFNTKCITTKLEFSEGDVVSIPTYYLDADDLALLLEASDPAQLSIIDKALKYVRLFKNTDEVAVEYKNNIIAKALLDLLSSGKTSTQIRDQVTAVLSSFNTADINLDSKIIQPGYVRTLKQCLNIDQSGKINTIQLVVEFLEPFANKEVEDKKFEDENIFYTLKDLYDAFEFSLVSEGILKSDKVYDKSNILKVRLEQIIKSNKHIYFDTNEYIPKNEYIKKFFTAANGSKAQIVNINLNYIEERFAKILTKIYTKLLFNYSVNLKNRASFPIHIILEEAHRYVQNDNDINVIGYNIFDRVTKEGRKYGVLLGLITQRVSELSSTALSQCSNFLIYRMYHPNDLKLVEEIAYNINSNKIDLLKTMRPGIGICFGNAFSLPCLYMMDLPDPMPQSTNADIENLWYQNNPSIEITSNINENKEL